MGVLYDAKLYYGVLDGSKVNNCVSGCLWTGLQIAITQLNIKYKSEIAATQHLKAFNLGI